MDEEKKSELDWKEAERVGPYQLHEPLPQTRLGQGELYRATHTTSGVAALVLKPAAGEDAAPPKDWRVSLISSASPDYVALEVVDSPWSVAPDKHSMESLVFTFEGVREGVRQMDHALAAPERRLRRHLRLVLVGAAAACALLFALVCLAPMSQPPSGPEPLAGTAPGPMDPDPYFSSSLLDTTDAGESVLARPLPSEPFKGQKRPPCNRNVEVELIGACWTPHELKAPCPDELFEYQGKCYLPGFSAKPPPQSFEP